MIGHVPPERSAVVPEPSGAHGPREVQGPPDEEVRDYPERAERPVADRTVHRGPARRSLAPLAQSHLAAGAGDVALAVDGAVRAAVVFRMGVFFLVSFVRSFVRSSEFRQEEEEGTTVRRRVREGEKEEDNKIRNEQTRGGGREGGPALRNATTRNSDQINPAVLSKKQKKHTNNSHCQEK